MAAVDAAEYVAKPPPMVLMEGRQRPGHGGEDAHRRAWSLLPTTKGERGTGLGLPWLYGVVQRHSAKIEITSAVGHGTTVA